MHTAQTVDIDALITAIKVLNVCSDERCTYDKQMRETTHYDGLAAQLVIKDQLLNGDEVTLPDAATVERMEEQLSALFTASHILSRVYTSLHD